jgi:hypothetical protein
MVDVEEQREVVQTTMLYYPNEGGEQRKAIWYRGQARCEQALRAQEHAEQAARSEIIRKYR